MLHIQKAALWLDERQGKGRVESRQPPLLCLPTITASALLPVFAVIEGTSKAGAEELRAKIECTVETLEAALNERQIEWLRTFIMSIVALQPLPSKGN